MKKFTATAVITAIVFLIGCGGGDTVESVSRDMIANMKTMAGIMDGISDEASAKAAIPKIEAVRTSMRECASRAKPLKISPAEEKELEAKLGKDKVEAMQALMQARQKLDEKPQLLGIIAPALQGIENDL